MTTSKNLMKATTKYAIELPDRQLCCAPILSPEGEDYLGAMAAAANFAFANRQLITHWVQETLEQVLGLRTEGPAVGTDLRRLPQHSQVRGTRSGRENTDGSASTAKEPLGPFLPVIPRSPLIIGIWDNRF